MKKTIAFAACFLAIAACNKMPNVPDDVVVKHAVRIAPVMTKATETAFENGDAIGLTITRQTDDYVNNKQFTYNGLEFSSDLDWYTEGNQASTLSAYYPYDAKGVPTTFSVATDQSAGTSTSDFIAAFKDNVLPSADAVTMLFQHKLARLVINVTNNAGYSLEGMVVKGAIPTATLAADFTAAADVNVNPVDISAYKSGETAFEVILPPQTIALTVQLTASGNVMQQKLLEAALTAGKKYSINLVVNQASMEVKLAGEITDWVDGGPLEPDNSIQFEENLSEGWFTYDNVKYNIKQMGDGKYWMVQNLRYIPEGLTVSSDLTAVTAGVFAPVVVNAGHTALEFSTSADVVAAHGYLYQAEVALGLKVGDLTTVAAAQALEGAKGICPVGWHLPTIEDITGLVGKSVGAVTNESAPYYDSASGQGSISLLNAAGFNMDAFGAVSIQDNTKTNGTFMGWASGYPEKISSGMFCGSSYAGVSYNTANDDTSGVKNLQFFGFMPMTNKTAEAQYTCNGTKVSYRIAAPVRCVRN